MCEIGRERAFLIRQLSKAPTFIGKAGTIARIVHIRQPQHDRPQTAFALREEARTLDAIVGMA
jgi:hypothetical protein